MGVLEYKISVKFSFMSQLSVTILAHCLATIDFADLRSQLSVNKIHLDVYIAHCKKYCKCIATGVLL